MAKWMEDGGREEEGSVGRLQRALESLACQTKWGICWPWGGIPVS